jgi:hypothetical protein
VLYSQGNAKELPYLVVLLKELPLLKVPALVTWRFLNHLDFLYGFSYRLVKSDVVLYKLSVEDIVSEIIAEFHLIKKLIEL